MREYEICIFKNDGSASIIATEIQLNDNAAIRSAYKLAQGRKLAYGAGRDCVYGLSTKPPIGAPPNPGAAV